MHLMEKQYSTPVDWIGQEHLGFVINVAFSEENLKLITDWLAKMNQHIPKGLYAMAPKGLHITVLDWVAPLFEYNGADKRQLFEELAPDYATVFQSITNDMPPFDVHFNELRVTPGAIILIGQDNGQFASLRSRFMDNITLPEGGKQPPNIIHSSLARFIRPEIELSPVEDYVQRHPIDLSQRISEFRLVETRREPMQDFTVLDRFQLAA